VPLNIRDGLSGACLETRQPQLSVDTESDPRVNAAVSRHLGIRSILIVPVFGMHNDGNAGVNHDVNDTAKITGILEVFSSSPAAFSNSDQKLLEGFAEQCARICRAALEVSQRVPPAMIPLETVPPETVPPKMFPPKRVSLDILEAGKVLPEIVSSPRVAPDFTAASPLARSHPYEAWTLILGGLAIFATIAVSFLIGSRVGWLSSSQTAQSIQVETAPLDSCAGKAGPGCPPEPTSPGQGPAVPAASLPTNKSALEGVQKRVQDKVQERTPKQKSPVSAASADELVVYEKGKVIFRMKPIPASPVREKSGHASLRQSGDSVVEASSSTRLAASAATSPIATSPLATSKSAASNVWLSPTQAETRLLSRTEPHYPAEALAAHRAGDVVLEVQVAEDGSVSNIRTLSGDPLLAAAASEAVRNWRYRPYRLHDRPSQFQTDVTLSFTLPN
ncbi:MAG: TonB family protein, partial [Terriglobales bacterium]